MGARREGSLKWNLMENARMRESVKLRFLTEEALQKLFFAIRDDEKGPPI